jgi:hypothetical protein
MFGAFYRCRALIETEKNITAVFFDVSGQKMSFPPDFSDQVVPFPQRQKYSFLEIFRQLEIFGQIFLKI